jgi:hypothetical protein
MANVLYVLIFSYDQDHRVRKVGGRNEFYRGERSNFINLSC